MDKSKYLTVSEFAKIRGISNQAVYKQLTTKLSTYVVIVDNKKMLKKQVLDDLGLNPVDNQVDNNSLKVDNPIQDDYIEFLKNQIKEKDLQIQKLQLNAEEKDKYIQEQGNRLTDLIEQSNQLQQNNQVLLKMLSGTTVEDKDKPIDISVNDEEDVQEDLKQEKKNKKGLFRLFR